MPRRVGYLAAVLALVFSGTLRADILYETTPGPGGLGGIEILPVQFVGSRFTLNSAAYISGIIGEVEFTPYGQDVNSFFMTLLQLPGPNALPNNLKGDPFGDTIQIYTTTFSAGPDRSTQDVLLRTSLYVPAGTYAVVFGTGMFGAGDGVGYMPQDTRNVLHGADLITWFDSTDEISTFAGATWSASQNNGERFVVEGTTIPEPFSAVLASLSLFELVLAISMGRVRNRATRESSR